MSQTKETAAGRAETPGVGSPPSERIHGFNPHEHVVVQALEHDAKNWKVVAALSYEGQSDVFSVPLGMSTDFASVPRFFVWLLPRYGLYTKAAIVHDYLWRQAVPDRITRREADAIFRRAMRDLDVAFLRRWLMWAAVRWGSLSKKDAREGWWRDAWRVVPLTILAAPIVVPPAVLILLALFLFWLVELAVWAPLNVAGWVKDRLHKPRKRVNRPRLFVKL